MRRVGLQLSWRARPRAGAVLGVVTWGGAAAVWLVAVGAAQLAARALPERAGPLGQLVRDGATWGVAGNACGMLAAVLWQRRRRWTEAAHERSFLTLAFGNVVALGWAVANALLPAPLLAAALPPLFALSLAAGAGAAALSAALPCAVGWRQHG